MPQMWLKKRQQFLKNNRSLSEFTLLDLKVVSRRGLLFLPSLLVLSQPGESPSSFGAADVARRCQETGGGNVVATWRLDMTQLWHSSEIPLLLRWSEIYRELRVNAYFWYLKVVEVCTQCDPVYFPQVKASRILWWLHIYGPVAVGLCSCCICQIQDIFQSGQLFCLQFDYIFWF